MSREEFRFKSNGKKTTVIIEPDSDNDTNDTNSEIDDTICSFDHCIVNETSNAQCQNPIHLNIDNELYENNDDDDDDIASHSDNELLPLSDNDEHELLPGRDTPYSQTISEEIDEYDSDATDIDLDGQSPEILQCTEGQEQSNISNLFKNP